MSGAAPSGTADWARSVARRANAPAPSRRRETTSTDTVGGPLVEAGSTVGAGGGEDLHPQGCNVSSAFDPSPAGAPAVPGEGEPPAHEEGGEHDRRHDDERDRRAAADAVAHHH